MVTVLTVGIIVSLLTGKTDLKCLDPELISPVIHWTLPVESQQYAGSAMRKLRSEDVDKERIMTEMRFTTMPLSSGYVLFFVYTNICLQ